MDTTNDKIMNEGGLSVPSIENMLKSLARLNISTEASLNTSTGINIDISDSSFDHPSTSRKRMKTRNYSNFCNIKKRRVEIQMNRERRRRKKKHVRRKSLSPMNSSCESFYPRPNYVIAKNFAPLATSTPSNSPTINFLSSVDQFQSGFRPPKIKVRPQTRRAKRRMKSCSSSKDSRCEPEDYPSSGSLDWESDDTDVRSSTEYRQLANSKLASNMIHDEEMNIFSNFIQSSSEDKDN